MIPTCPACHSDQVQHCHYGKRVGGTIGTVAGAFSGASGATAGALEFSMPEFAFRRTRPARSNDPVPEMDWHVAIFTTLVSTLIYSSSVSTLTLFSLQALVS